MIGPGSIIGILGGGQLGRMLILAGRNLGYRFVVYEPTGPSTAGKVADKEINAAYEDEVALEEFARSSALGALYLSASPTRKRLS